MTTQSTSRALQEMIDKLMIEEDEIEDVAINGLVRNAMQEAYKLGSDEQKEKDLWIYA